MKRAEIRNLFTDLNIYDNSLQENCKHCNSCWKGIEKSKWSIQDTDKYGDFEKPHKISLPFIGEKYDDLKLLVVGLNLNHYGGEDALQNLVKWSHKELKANKRRINFGSKKYRGSVYWHRLPSYSTLYLEKNGILPKVRNNNFPPGKNLIEAFKYIAITNGVKCSPNRDRSEPTGMMKYNCSKYILKKEIEILDPKHLLILGTANMDAFKNNVFDEITSLQKTDNIHHGKGILNSKEITFHAVYHPAYPRGGSKVELFNTLESLI